MSSLRRKRKKEFNEMTRAERKKFLSMDMAERMIRVEQKISSHFNKNIPCKETEYYKSMSKKDKEEFDNYIKKKKKSKILVSLLIILPIVALIVLNTSVTASVIKENFQINYSNSTQFLIWAFAMFLTVLVLCKSLAERAVDSRYNSQLDVFDHLSVGKTKRHKKKGF